MKCNGRLISKFDKESIEVPLSELRATLLPHFIYNEILTLEKYGFTSKEIYAILFKSIEFFPFFSIIFLTDNSDISIEGKNTLSLNFYKDIFNSEEIKSKRGYVFLYDDKRELCINNVVDFLEITKGISIYPERYLNPYTKRDSVSYYKEKSSHKNRPINHFAKSQNQKVIELNKFSEDLLNSGELSKLRRRGRAKAKINQLNRDRDIKGWFHYTPRKMNWKMYSKAKKQYELNLKRDKEQWVKDVIILDEYEIMEDENLC